MSVLAPANRIAAPFLLTMSDHLFDNMIVDRLTESADPDFLNVTYLEQAKSGNGGRDCSLANGMEVMAAKAKVRGIDTPRVLPHAEHDTKWRVLRSAS